MDSRFRKYFLAALEELIEARMSVSFRATEGEESYYYHTKKKLVCRTNAEDWHLIFLHEYCHFLQFKEGKYSTYKWENKDKTGYLDKVDQWVRGKITLSDEELRLCARKARVVEADCLRRQIAEIKKHNLDVDIERHIQEETAYIYSYNMMPELGRDCSPNPGDVDEIVEIMPTRLLSRYDRTPKKYRELVLKHC